MEIAAGRSEIVCCRGSRIRTRAEKSTKQFYENRSRNVCKEIRADKIGVRAFDVCLVTSTRRDSVMTQGAIKCCIIMLSNVYFYSLGSIKVWVLIRLRARMLTGSVFENDLLIFIWIQQNYI